MRARASDPRQKHIPTGQPCRMKSPKDRFHHKRQLTDHNWQDSWQEDSFLGILPPSVSVDMSHHFCHKSPWFMFAWHKLSFMWNQTWFLSQSTMRQEGIPVSSCQKPMKSKSLHPKMRPEQAFSCFGNVDGSVPLLLGLNGALTHGCYPTVINASDIISALPSPSLLPVLGTTFVSRDACLDSRACTLLVPSWACLSRTLLTF